MAKKPNRNFRRDRFGHKKGWKPKQLIKPYSTLHLRKTSISDSTCAYCKKYVFKHGPEEHIKCLGKLSAKYRMLKLAFCT